MADADAEELMRVYDQFNGQAPEGAPPAVQAPLSTQTKVIACAWHASCNKHMFCMQKLFDEISESKSKSSAAEQSAEETETLYPKPECATSLLYSHGIVLSDIPTQQNI